MRQIYASFSEKWIYVKVYQSSDRKLNGSISERQKETQKKSKQSSLPNIKLLSKEAIFWTKKHSTQLINFYLVKIYKFRLNTSIDLLRTNQAMITTVKFAINEAVFNVIYSAYILYRALWYGIISSISKANQYV